MVLPTSQPQLIVTVPQFAPAAEHTAAGSGRVHPHLFGVPPPPHVSGATHVFASHARVPPHPSVTVPQSSPAQADDFDFGVQPHRPGVPPPPQKSVPPHEPHDTVPPHPFGADPHSTAPHATFVAVGVQLASAAVSAAVLESAASAAPSWGTPSWAASSASGWSWTVKSVPPEQPRARRARTERVRIFFMPAVSARPAHFR